MHPKISVVTVTYNCESDVASTIESVLRNNYPNIEYIVIDGKSTDKTYEIIQSYNEYIAHHTSETDDGIFDAMNKGIKSATGDWILFLNAGDLLDPELDFSDLRLEKHIDVALIYGNTFDIGSVGRKPFTLNALRYNIIMACHQSMLFNTRLLGNNLYYNTSYRYYGDFELVNRLFMAKYKFLYVDITIAHFLGNGFSSHISWHARWDKVRMVMRHYGIPGLYRMFINKIGYKPY